MTDMLEPFSILERIEWAATGEFATPTPCAGPFQYPRTDRMGCNLTFDSSILPTDTSFSILERIEWAATELVSLLTEEHRAFSILERIEWAATGLSQIRPAAKPLSFSILERIEWAATIRRSCPLSVLTIFQYPRTDRMGCD